MKMPPKDKTPRKPHSKHCTDVYQVSHQGSLNDKRVSWEHHHRNAYFLFSFPLPFLNLRNPPTSSSPSVQAGQHATPTLALLSTHPLLFLAPPEQHPSLWEQPLHRTPKPTLLRGSTTPASTRPPTANKCPVSALQRWLALLRSSLHVVLPQPPTPHCSNEAGWVALPHIHKPGVPKLTFGI